MKPVAMVIGAASIALCGCDWMERRPPPPRTDAAKARLEQIRRACASQLTYARLKEYVFDEAARIAKSDPGRLDLLAAHSVVRMDQPVVKSRDNDLNITVCSGRFVLNLPPGVRDSFDGRTLIAANVEYAAQAAADGSGLVYSMNGAEPIIYRIAALGLPARQLPHMASVESAPADPPAPVAQIEPRSPSRPPAIAQARPEPRPAPATATKPAARQEVRTAASPSFNCRYARTRSEKMICGNGALAAADRRMSAAFYGELANASPEAKRALRRSRDQFLARRERCSTPACVARVYEERVAEIRTIAR
ncbi:MAG TPA: hypothetical protein VF079_01930 [Sphingomicrobium sp.]